MNDATRTVTRPLTIPSGSLNLDNSTIPQRVQEPGQIPSPVLSSPVAGGEESVLKPVATSGAKFFLQGVNESPGGFPLLKSVAEGLCFVLENCEVWLSTPHLFCNAHGFPGDRGEYRRYRIVGTPDQSAFRVTQCTYSPGRYS